MSKRFRRPRQIAALFLCGALVWLVYTAARSRVLLGHGRTIEARSATFARDYAVGDAGAPTLTYLAMGDSTAAGWGAGSLAATYPHRVAQWLARRGFRVRVVNVAVGGATIADVRAAQIAAIGEIKPDVITLSVGANDATHFTAPTDFARDLASVLSAFEASDATQILVADTPDMWLAPALPTPLSWASARRARAQNVQLRALARGKRVRIVELYERGKLDARVDAGLYAADRFHPSATGYAIWARLFIEQLRRGKRDLRPLPIGRERSM